MKAETNGKFDRTILQWLERIVGYGLYSARILSFHEFLNWAYLQWGRGTSL